MRGYEKKWCKRCGSKLQKWGKNRSVSVINHKKIFIEWLLGKLELGWYATKYGVTRQTLFNWFVPFWLEEP